MLKFTYLFNFGLVGALVVPGMVNQGASVEQLTQAIETTDNALRSLQAIEVDLEKREYAAVEEILAATEAPLGGERERSELLDQLRSQIGVLDTQLQEFNTPSPLEHLQTDPTEVLALPENGGTEVATTGLSDTDRVEVSEVWPPIPGDGSPRVRLEGNLITVEKPGFTVDALRQGRAYYRAGRYREALVLFTTREGEPQADYWIGRCLERMNRPTEAVAAYTRVIENEESGVLGERAESDRSFLRWLIDFDRKVTDHEEVVEAKK